MRIEVAVAREGCLRSLPTTGIWIAASDVCWDGISREEVNRHGCAGPLRSVYAAMDGIETGTEGLGARGTNQTTGVSCLSLGVDIAVGCHHSACIGRGRLNQRTGCVGMQCHVIGSCRVHSFNDVNLAIRWPSRSDHPA
jgi:hypothetical protein